jgi:hypothetical protein
MTCRAPILERGPRTLAPERGWRVAFAYSANSGGFFLVSGRCAHYFMHDVVTFDPVTGADGGIGVDMSALESASE